MNPTLFTSLKIFFALFCIGFGIDKFIPFLPICSLTNYFPPYGMTVLGGIEMGLGILLLLKMKTLLLLRLITAIMIGAVLLHLFTGSFDFGGALIGSAIGLLLIFETKKTISNDN